ncbi:hypothetical protein P4O66_013209 [Electrophorus voltai]|uniref:Uncharacterized protein n=1 Tax=Electrophorus voltai TaxID=2609070 RepID=A0AAD8Z1A9_9TELE|nr:hypothetical protein P4O66_013209 [Electrophorus voltai]
MAFNTLYAIPKKTNTSYAIIFTFSLSNISMPDSTDLRNITYRQVQDSINNMLNIFLNEPGAEPFEPKTSVFITSGNQVEGNMDYIFQDGDIKRPISFFTKLNAQSDMMTTTLSTDSITLNSTTTPTLLGSVIIYIDLVFKNLTSVPSQAEVLSAANILLDSSVKIKRSIRKLNNPVRIHNITYQRTSENSYIISFGFILSNVSIALDIELRNETYDLIQNTINILLNKILNAPNASPFIFQRANYMGNATVIQANAQYIFGEGDIKSPSGFLAQILKVSGLMYTTTFSTPVTPAQTTTPHPVLLNATRPANNTNTGGQFPGWVLPIIIPCSIAVILVLCWILLWCLLCGCCAALRRRYNRRRSYNVQYSTQNGLF